MTSDCSGSECELGAGPGSQSLLRHLGQAGPGAEDRRHSGTAYDSGVCHQTGAHVSRLQVSREQQHCPPPRKPARSNWR